MRNRLAARVVSFSEWMEANTVADWQRIFTKYAIQLSLENWEIPSSAAQLTSPFSPIRTLGGGGKEGGERMGKECLQAGLSS